MPSENCDEDDGPSLVPHSHQAQAGLTALTAAAAKAVNVAR